ncbi:Rhodanese-like [Rhodoferax ferrireducens T118]|uniref:Rhodanese-like n=1 Tax=Albidiferax ferrireducens (strain ATCC BAA-621 / DSM 15236 / T118) TaxID=338969 RepID=Q21SC0_ALBFT|nr:rhodanese-like domain-containing protein [Rhodoferax ferrireducens]ABD71333.1 Rhodanese-like [Rhodoferax ferrireducens T118]
MKRLILAVALVATTLSAAISWNAHAAEQQLEANEVANEQMVSYFEQGMIGKSVWVVDSRPAGKYSAGHIPGALSLPLDMLRKDAASAEKLGIPKTGKVIFYCAGRECTLSVDSAEIFRKMGYADAWVYRNGVPGWTQKAQPLLAEASFVQKGNLILIDTSPGKETIVTESNKLVQLSISDFKGSPGQTALGTLSKNAPIIVVGRGDLDAVNATLEELRERDFRRLAYFPLSAWKGALAMAPALTTVTWAPVYGPGQVAPKAFEEAVAAGKFILDVRPVADYARGHFKGAVSLPIEEMEKDYAKIPKDVPVFVNCASGAKSQKTFDILGRKGYVNVSYLDAEVACKGEICTIKE